MQDTGESLIEMRERLQREDAERDKVVQLRRGPDWTPAEPEPWPDEPRKRIADGNLDEVRAKNRARREADFMLVKAIGLSLGAVRRMPPEERNEILARAEAIAE